MRPVLRLDLKTRCESGSRSSVARPSKKQLAERKAAKRIENRTRNLDILYDQLNEMLLWDELEIACEGCGQQQLSGNPVCVVCGHDVGHTISV